MAGNLLVVHMRFPDGAGEALDRGYFARVTPESRRLQLNDPMHALRARYPEELDPLPPEVRLVSGPLPFGYMDHVARRAVHVGVLSDPAVAFLRFAARVAEAGAGEAIRLTGAAPDELSPDDPDLLVRQLLDLPRVRQRCAGAMTRLCAGLPWRTPDPAPAEHLRAAMANLRRINFLAAPEAELEGFADYLSGVLGWDAVPSDLRALLPPPLVKPEALDPAARRALTECTVLDRRLLQEVRTPELSRFRAEGSTFS